LSNKCHIDVEFANTLAKLESYNKHLYRPNSYLHKWWARRCGSTFRLILKHLVENDAQRDYYAPGGLEGKIILDPMIGGGTTLHEAIRLGANVIGADIDPIPVLQARATLSAVPLEQLEKAFAELQEGLRLKLAPLYLTACPICARTVEMRFMLYGVQRACSCGPAVLVDSLILRHNADDSVIRICPHTRNIFYDDQLISESIVTETRPPILEKKIKTCPTCGGAYQENVAIPFYTRYEPIAVFGECPEHGLFFAAPQEPELGALARADAQREQLDFGPPAHLIEAGPKTKDLIRRGITNYLDVFSSRQLLYLHEAIERLRGFESLIRLNLGLLVSTSVELNAMLCGYKGASKHRAGAVRHTFSYHAYSFPYTALENNPVYPANVSGSLQNLFHSRIRRGRKWARLPIERRIQNGKIHQVAIQGEIDQGEETTDLLELQSGRRRFLLFQGSSASLDLDDDSVDYVVTDPPYFDSVQYSDLAAFFRVWLRRLLPTDAQWDYALDESAVGPHANGNGQYTQVLSAIFAECGRVLKKERGRLIFTFHHWNPRGWAALTLALKRAGFTLRNYYIVHSENPTSVHISNQNALTHDAILVLAPWPGGRATASATRTVRLNLDGKSWERPAAVDKTDSHRFTSDCAMALGWMLNAEMDEGEIEQQWDTLLE